jgi:hypothetical protein
MGRGELYVRVIWNWVAAWRGLPGGERRHESLSNRMQPGSWGVNDQYGNG